MFNPMIEMTDASDNSDEPMVTDEDLNLIEAFFKGMCYDMKDAPAYKGSAELSAVNMEGDVYASNDTNQVKYKAFTDAFCDFVYDAFKPSRMGLDGDGYAALDADVNALMF